jgi:hypothetical protein
MLQEIIVSSPNLEGYQLPVTYYKTHSEFSPPISMPAKPCRQIFNRFLIKEIEVCQDHVNKTLLPFYLMHEEFEILFMTNSNFYHQRLKESPINVDSPILGGEAHNLANSEVYRVAAEMNQLELIHTQWLKGCRKLEDANSKKHRERLFKYYQGADELLCP